MTNDEIYLMTSDIEVVRTFVANTAYEALRDYVFAVIPLFMLMGDFLTLVQQNLPAETKMKSP